MLNTIKKFYNEFKPAINFLLRLLLTYAVFSICYSFWIKSYGINPDPITMGVAKQLKGILLWFYNDVSISPRPGDASMDVFINGKYTISVFEGCNGAAIFYLFFAFLVGYWGGFKRLALFTAIGVIVIHLFNLLRLLLLSVMALNNSSAFHFIHKYVFTLSIYIIVFALWVIWIRMIKPAKKEETPANGTV